MDEDEIPNTYDLEGITKSYCENNDFTFISDNKADVLSNISKDYEFIKRVKNFYPVCHFDIEEEENSYKIFFIYNKKDKEEIFEYLKTNYGEDLKIHELNNPLKNSHTAVEIFKAQTALENGEFTFWSFK